MYISPEFRHEQADKLLKDLGLTEFHKQMEKDRDNMLLQAAWMRKCVKPLASFTKGHFIPHMHSPTDAETLEKCIKEMSRHGRNSEQYKDARKTMMALFKKVEGGVN